MHRRLRVVLRGYNANGGLSNQFYCHVDVVAIAMAAGAEVVLSSAWHRNSTFSVKYAERPWPMVRALPLRPKPSSPHVVDPLTSRTDNPIRTCRPQSRP